MNPIIMEDIENILTGGPDLSPLKNRTVLITGAYGMLASYLVYVLCVLNERDPDQQITILAQGRNEKRMLARFGEFMDRSYFHPVYEDIAEMKASKADYIIHAASPTDPRVYLRDPSSVIRANVTATEHLLDEAARGVTKRFLFVSSGEVYGRLEKDQIREEDGGSVTTSDPRNVYALSKILGERLCRDYAEKGKTEALIVRPSHTYGPTMDLQRDGRVFAEFTRAAVEGKDIVMKSDGLATRAFTYISDAADAYLRILLCGQSGQAYNVTDNAGIRSVREIAGILKNASPAPIGTVFGSPDKDYRENANRKASIRSTEKLEALGWRASVQPEQGFTRTLRAFLIAKQDIPSE